jgi:hypothetical protein
MHNLDNRADALSYLADLIACYRDFQSQARGLHGGVAEAWQRKVETARACVSRCIFLIRENDFEGAWTA